MLLRKLALSGTKAVLRKLLQIVSTGPAQRILLLAVCLGLPAQAINLEFTVSDGTVYTIQSSDRREAKVAETLSPEGVALFEARRHLYLTQMLNLAHRSRALTQSTIAFDRLWRRLRRLPASRLSVSEQVHRRITGMAMQMNAQLLAHAGVVAESNRSGLQISVGGGGGLALASVGVTGGIWWNTNIDFPSSKQGFDVRMNLDAERLIWVLPAVVSIGVGLKIMFYFGFDSNEADVGTSDYPAFFLPHVMLMNNTVAVGTMQGVFLPPAPYLINLHERAYRSSSISLGAQGMRVAQFVKSCSSILSALGRRFITGREREVSPLVAPTSDEPAVDAVAENELEPSPRRPTEILIGNPP